MNYDFDSPPDRHDSESFKWQSYTEDVLPMFVADMDFISPKPVADALTRRSQHGVFGYPRGLYGRETELPELREVVVAHLKDRYKWRVNPQELVFIPGVVTAVNLACHAFVDPENAVLVQTPVYPPILSAAQTTGVMSQEMELTCLGDGSYVIDPQAFEAAITEQTRMFILCNPHNPVGRVFKREELEFMAETCLRHNVLICADEIHSDLTFSGHQHIPIASLGAEIAQKTITLIAPSKTYNLAGLQCSIAIIQDAELRSRFMAARKGLVPWVNLMGLIAAKVAYLEGQEWLEQVMQYLENNRNIVNEFVGNHLPGVSMIKPEATYLAWLNFRESGINQNPYEFLLDKARVALNDGRSFGRGGDGFVRLNFGCSQKVLIEGLGRIQQALEHI